MIVWIKWAPLVGVFGLIVAALIYNYVRRQPAGSDLMIEISESVHDGAMISLKREYQILSVSIIVLFVLLMVFVNHKIAAVAFLCGALLSMGAGFFGVKSATRSNVRTAHAALELGRPKAFSIAFSGAAIVGLSASGLGLLGVGVLSRFLGGLEGAGMVPIVVGFAMGTSLTALFANFGGGIYTKLTGIGAGLVGMDDISKTDLRGLSITVDKVWDNVRDIAGMEADIFESYVGSMVATVVIGATDTGGMVSSSRLELISFPILLAVIGMVSSIVGVISARAFQKMGPAAALRYSACMSIVLFLIGSFLAIRNLGIPLVILWVVLSGCIAGIAVGLLSGYYTLGPPVKRIASSAGTGPATNVISGLAAGMKSVVLPAIAICLATWIAYRFVGFYGIGISAVGMIATAGITMSVNAYGPIAGNAAGIAEISGLGSKVGEITGGLDAIGGTTSAIGKGFALGAAALTALALLSAYTRVVNLEAIDLTKANVAAGIFIGGFIPFLIASLALTSVDRVASRVAREIRRQFGNARGIVVGKSKSDAVKCVDIGTRAAIREIAVPGASAIVCPIAVGLVLGAEALGGFLAGAILSGILIAIMMINAGGALYSARSYIERGYLGGEGSEAHKAAVVGERVGVPFRDASGPSMNTLMKLMAVVSLLMAPLFMR